MIPIVAVRTDAQLGDNLAALEIDLQAHELEALDQASRVPLGFPGDSAARALLMASASS